jgi:hypothetical protein
MEDIVSSSSSGSCSEKQRVPASSGTTRAQGTAEALESFEEWLVSGGDERIAVDPTSKRNRYGTPSGKACGEAWFSSSTAAAISPRGYDAAFLAYCDLANASGDLSVSTWLDRIRARLTAVFGIPGSEVILSGSGTELELLALFLAQSVLPEPLTNLLVAPAETGRGVLLAASGRHFLGSTAFRGKVEQAVSIEGFGNELLTGTVEIRDAHGQALSLDKIDEEVTRRVENGIANGRSVLVHLLDCSKTNRCGPRRSTAAALVTQYPGRVLVVVDGCQLRCSPDQIREDLRAGFMVMITGSKFAAGPPFAGAILVPPAIVEGLDVLELPPGLAAYTAAGDWPTTLRRKIGQPFAAPYNIGAGLRWEAALAELERVFALPVQFRDAVAGGFANTIRQCVSTSRYLALIDDVPPVGECQSTRTIHPIVTLAGSNSDLASEHIHHQLRLPPSDGASCGASKSVFHVGQPVRVGSRSVLRVCLSATHIVDVAEDIARGKPFEAALAPLLGDIDGLFLKWARIADELGRNRSG